MDALSYFCDPWVYRLAKGMATEKSSDAEASFFLVGDFPLLILILIVIQFGSPAERIGLGLRAADY
jgi:hypothetical protein